jgi:UPF0755 protein
MRRDEQAHDEVDMTGVVEDEGHGHLEAHGEDVHHDDWDDHAYIRLPGHSSFGRRVAWAIGGFLLVVLVLGAGFVFWLNGQVNPSGGPGKDVSVEIAKGATVNDLAKQLENEGVVSNALVFRLYARWKGFKSFEAGTYPNLAEKLAMGDVIARIQKGPATPPPAGMVTLAEGLELSQVTQHVLSSTPSFDAKRLAAAYAKATPKYRPAGVTTLEGLLFPDTYRIEQADAKDEQALVDQMVSRFEKVADGLGYQDAKARRGLTPYEVITIASIIEREAKLPADRPKIARVIYNRLAQGMPLGIDATLLYALGHKETLTQSDLDTPSPYNTRLNLGLPPTPISMPGKSSLEAALNPAPGPWLYYVLTNKNGGHSFTADYNEFLRLAQQARDQGVFK